MLRSTFNKVVLFTVYSYVEKQLNDTEHTYQRDALRNITARISGFRSFHKFSEYEAKELKALGDTEPFERVRKIEVDYSIYAIELLYLWVNLVPKNDRPVLNISDRKIKELRANLTKDMLRLKLGNSERKDEVKGIVDQSKMTAKRFTHLLDNEVKKI